MKTGMLLLKSAPKANSVSIARFLTTLPGAKVLFSEGAYSFIASFRSEELMKEASKRLHKTKQFIGIEEVTVGVD